MNKRTVRTALDALQIGAPAAVFVTMWVHADGKNDAARLINLRNSAHGGKIELTAIRDNRMATKLATGVPAGVVPDIVSFNLIGRPDFMKVGFLTA